MTLERPYKRIARPYMSPSSMYFNNPVDQSYLAHNDYAPDRITAIRGYHAIESDLRRLFEYVEPHDNNLNTFSTRIYEILLRASTEFESNCRAILNANGYTRAGRWDMGDYKKIEPAMRLSEYELHLSIWADSPRLIRPLCPWAADDPLPWYQAYNSVKHNRADNFSQANLENAVNAVAALFAILFAQFNVLAFSAHEVVSIVNDSEGELGHHNSIFWIKQLRSWDTSECYSFDSVPTGYNSFDF